MLVAIAPRNRQSLIFCGAIDSDNIVLTHAESGKLCDENALRHLGMADDAEEIPIHRAGPVSGQIRPPPV